jgi:NAD(P)-dependent dehydrogenase (short-subunit alcohol dehydrogenase family)
MENSPKLMKGKTCVVTGATSGIGLSTVRALAGLGATIIVVGRNPQKCEHVTRKIKAETGNTQIEFVLADLSCQRDILLLCEQVKARYERLDVLVNNAGARFLTRCTTVDEIEMTFALNHLAYFLLTESLMERLKAAGKACIVNVASEAHRGATINFNDIQYENGYVGKQAYSQSKLANILFTYELAGRLNGSGVTVNAMSPGNVFTNFSRNNGWVSWAKHIASSILARDLVGPKKGADTVVYLASAAQAENVTGKYFINRQEISSSQASYDPVNSKRLWEISLRLTAPKK